MKTKFLVFILIIGISSYSFVTLGKDNSALKSQTDLKSFDYAALLGKSVTSPEAIKFLSTLSPNKQVEKAGEYPHWMYLEDGVELVITDENKIHALFFNNVSWMYKTAFRGYLPYKLKMSDTRKIVEQKLGTGELEKSYSGLKINWKSKNIQISFKSKIATDMENKIDNIQFRTW